MSKQVFQTSPPWVEVRCSEPVPFYFARRKGKDSIAVLLYRKKDGYDCDEFLIRMQPLVHIDDGNSKELFSCPITGGLELDETPYSGALREVYEESGYLLEPGQLFSLGSYIATTQMDEVVHCFSANVTDLIPEEAIQDGTFHESISKNVWLSETKLEDLLFDVSQPVYSGLFYCWGKLND